MPAQKTPTPTPPADLAVDEDVNEPSLLGAAMDADDPQADEGQTPVPADKPAAGQQKPGTDAKAPADADYSLKTPESPVIGDEVMKTYTDAVKKLNLPKEAAQGLLDQVLPAFEAQQNKLIQDTRKAWKEAARSDKDVGGERFEQSRRSVGRILRTYGNQELRTWLDDTGVGDNPHLFKMLVKFASALGEERTDLGLRTAAKPRSSPADVLYGPSES
jgi:hypothetical protein